ncbi:hypothetical protein [Brachybacterium squillarum]|uniref:hypothetical protein n=1 Tax=Brachybacterium squillarum TaxID=661979 RepID=UPI000262949B|nr:hypothetical protein [Brachybacterium squillarum]
MSFLISLFVVLHMLCWAVALGTWVAAARTRTPNPGMAHAAAGALVFGLVLMVLVSIGGDPDHVKLGIKFLLAAVATAFAFVARNRGPETPSAIWFGIPVAIVANIVVAVFV